MNFELYKKTLKERLPSASNEELGRIAAGTELDAAEVAREILKQRKADMKKNKKPGIGFTDEDFVEKD